jgi:hypothetical protein
MGVKDWKWTCRSGKPLGNAMRVTPADIEKTGNDAIGMSIVQAESMTGALAGSRITATREIIVLEEMAVPEMEAPSSNEGLEDDRG